MKKVLIITYYWPPSGGAGVQRWLKFSKYLPQYGWEPVILTVKNGTFPTTDTTLEQEIPKDIKVYKTKTVEPFAIYNSLLFKKRKSSVSTGLTGIKNSKNPIKKWAQYIRANYMIPDARKGWNKYAFKEALKIISEHNIKVIVTTGPPHSSHIIGEKLKKSLNVKWIADLRDPWTTVYYNKMLPRSNRTVKKDQQIENRVLGAADCITVVGDQFKNEFPNHTDKIKVIYNGFDESDIDTKSSLNEHDKFTLSYVGNFKPNQSVPNLWNAIEKLIAENKKFKKYFRLQFVGAIDPKEKNYLEENLSSYIDLNGFVPHDEAVKAMQQASLLLFVIPNIDNNELIITGKVFEYLATESPLLSIGPSEGNAAHIIDKCNRRPMLNYDDTDQIKEALEHHFNQWLDNDMTKVIVKSEQLKDYTRANQTKNLTEILETL